MSFAQRGQGADPGATAQSGLETGELTSRPKQMTSSYDNYGAAWSPDGNTLAYSSSRTPDSFLVFRSANSGQERLPSSSCGSYPQNSKFWSQN